jgi:hypothetical protein
VSSLARVARMSESDIRGFFSSGPAYRFRSCGLRISLRFAAPGGTDLPVVSSAVAKNNSLFRLV